MTVPQFLPGVPVSHVLKRLANAGGKEIESDKFSSPESSAAPSITNMPDGPRVDAGKYRKIFSARDRGVRISRENNSGSERI